MPRRLAPVLLVLGGVLCIAAIAAPHRRTPRCAGQLVSATLGFAVCGDRVLLSGDARTWHEVTPPRLRRPIMQVRFLNRSTGWIVDNDCAAARASVYRTRDGGRTWRSTPVDFANCAAGSRLEVSFVDSNHGWLTRLTVNAPRFEFFRTLDGGRTWRKGGELPDAGELTLRTLREAWIARADFRDAALWRTRDGGRTWHRRSLRLPSVWRHARAFPDSPRFFRHDGVLPVDLVAGGRRAVAFFATSDSGRHWRVRAIRGVKVARPSNGLPSYAPVSIAGPSDWWLATSPRTIAVTTDAGLHWRTALGPRGTTLTAADGKRAWLSGMGLFASGDGGRSWRRLTP